MIDASCMILHVVFCDVLRVLPEHTWTYLNWSIMVNPLFLVLCQTLLQPPWTALRTWKPSWALGESQCSNLASWCRRSTRSSRQRIASGESSCSCIQNVSRCFKDIGHPNGLKWIEAVQKSFRKIRTLQMDPNVPTYVHTWYVCTNNILLYYYVYIYIYIYIYLKPQNLKNS